MSRIPSRGLASLVAVLVLTVGAPAGAWLTTVSGDAPAIDSGQAVAQAPDGSVVAAGTVLEVGIGTTLAVTRFTADGAPLWRRSVASDPIGFSEGRVLSVAGVAVDGDGDVVVAGTAPGDPKIEMVVAKLDGATGTPRWTVKITGGAGYSRAQDVALTADGDVLVAGELSVATDEGSSFTVVRLDGTNGAERWRFEAIGTNGYGVARAVATDPSGDVVAAGVLYNEDSDFAVFKLDGETGSFAWRKTLGGTGGSDEAFDVAVDVDGAIYASGGITPPNGSKDFAMARLRPDGGIEWISSFDGGATSFDESYALALGPPGFVVATGVTVSSDQSFGDFTVARFRASDGVVDRRITLGDPLDARTRDVGFTIAVDGNAGIIAAGRWAEKPFALHIRENGTRAWERSFDATPVSFSLDAIAGIALAPDGDPLVTGTVTSPESGSDFVVGRLDATDGTDVWQQSIDGTGTDSNDYGSAVALDPQGDVVAGGGLDRLTFRPDFTVVKTAGRTGSILWRRTIRTSGGDVFDGVRAVTTDAAGDVIAGGTVSGEAGPAFTVAKLASGDGGERWRTAISGGEASYGDAAHAVAVAPNGDVVAAGQTTSPGHGADFTVARLAAANGQERWRAVLKPPMGGFNDMATAVAIDAAGAVLAAGTIEYELTFIPVLTVVKLAPESGRELWRTAVVDDEDEPHSGVARALALDADGNAVAAGYIENDDRAQAGVVLSLAAATGRERWRFTLTNELEEQSLLLAVRVTPDGDVVAAGVVASSSRLGVIVLELDGRTGRERWRRVFGADDGLDAGAPALALGAGGDVLVSALVGEGLLLARLDAASGADVWQRPIPQSSIEFFGTALATDVDGNPVMVSSIGNPGSGSDLAIRKVSGDTGDDVICGDGTRDVTEACDDGNRVDGDCCSAACVVEDTPVCSPDDPGPDDPDDPDQACAGEDVPRRITRGIAKSEQLIATADGEPKPHRVVRLTRRAERTLGKTARLIERSAKPRRKKPAKLTAACAASLRSVVGALQASVSAGAD